MQTHEVEVVNGAGQIVISQGCAEHGPSVIVLTVEQVELFIQMVRAVAEEIQPRYPWWVRAGYGTEAMATAAGVCEG